MKRNLADVHTAAETIKEMKNTAQQRFEDLLEDVEFLFHEIRTPLTAVINYSEFLQERSLPAHEQDPLLDIIRREAQHIDNLLNDFSEIYHHDCGSWLAETSFSPIVVGDLLREAVTRFRNKSFTHTIRIAVSPDFPPVWGDREKLYLVIRNLLANAIKYSPEGGDISISAAECNENAIIGVRDHGVGIPEECLPNIFDRGFRGELPGCKNTRGSGLGLAVVKRIVEAHRGKVHVESEQGKGSLFLFSLPKYTVTG